jgi:inositol transport system substrate-binding protein
MKKFLAVLLVIMVAVGSIAAQSKVKIGVSMAVFDDVWLTYVRKAMISWAEQHPDIDLQVVDAKNDSARQLGQVENFLAQKMDAIVILPCDTSATGPMTQEVVAANIPLVYVNRRPDNLPSNVVYVGSNSIDAGIFNMEELGKAMHGKGNLVILMGQLDNEAAINRTKGIEQVCAQKFPAIHIIRKQTGNWLREQGRTIMENWLASGITINGVAANNDEMALGALMAIKAAGKLGQIPVGGTDGSADALASMARGELNNTVYQDPVGQGEGALEAAYLMAKHMPNPKIKDGVIWIPYVPITKANYRSFMK